MGVSRRLFTKEFKLAAVRRLEQGVSIPRGDNALIREELEDLAQNEDRLRRQHRDALRLHHKFFLRRGVTGTVTEQLENDLLLPQPSRPGVRLNCAHISRRKIAPKDVPQVFRHSIEFVDEELPFGLRRSRKFTRLCSPKLTHVVCRGTSARLRGG